MLDELNAHLDRDGEAALNTTILQLKHAGTMFRYLFRTIADSLARAFRES
ncbi:hypothetical protein [Vineibacter terrae]|nr:hypothetical protein [Vineibacter terrae]